MASVIRRAGLALLHLACRALAAEVLLIHQGTCDISEFSKQICDAQEKAAQKYPEHGFHFMVLDSGTCPSFMGANGSRYQLAVMVGFAFEDCSLQAAASSPDTWVAQLDGCPAGADQYPNLVCGTFRVEQSSYAAGYLAGLLSSSKVTGVVGGVPVPGVQQLFNGFILGVQAACPECRVEGMYVNSFFHPTNAAAVATHLVNSRGADVVYGCGGGTGSLAIQKAAELGSFVIGVDVDEFESTFASAPDEQRARLVTSVLKKIDVAIGILIDLLVWRRVGNPPRGLQGSVLIFDYANAGVGLANCHLSCQSVGPEIWRSVSQQEDALSSRSIQTGLDHNYHVQLLPTGHAPNTFHLVPSAAEPPSARFQAAMAAFGSGGALDLVVLFGGRGAAGTVLGDLWLYIVQSGQWLNSMHGMTVGTPPPPLAKACAVALGQTVFIFGGRTAAGQQSGALYGFTYQPPFKGLSSPTSPLIRHEWALYDGIGRAPLPVEGPGCTRFNATCGVIFGGRTRLTELNTLHMFCRSGAEIHWTQLFAPAAGQDPAPAAREGAGVAVVPAAALGLGAGAALVVAGGVSGGKECADVWALLLDGRAAWLQLPDLPHALMAPLVFSAQTISNSDVLIVQPSSALPDSGFSAFTFDWAVAAWNAQTTSFGDASRQRTKQAAMLSSGGRVWAFGGTVKSLHQDGLLALDFQLQIKCEPGMESVDLGCKSCEAGNYSLGGVGAACLECRAGTFAATSGASACADCGVGRFSNGTGRSECELCPRGRYKGAGDKRNPCLECPEGSYNPAEGSTSPTACVQCPPGRYTASTARQRPEDCLLCEPGRALAVPFFQSACRACEPGRFASAGGQALCAPCPKGSIQPRGQQDHCISCSQYLQGSTTEVLGAVDPADCLCEPGRFRDGNESVACKACIDGMVCPLGSSMQHYYAERFGHAAPLGPVRYPLLKPQFWSSSDEPLVVFKCHSPDRCPGGDPGSCANNETGGRACNACHEGFYMTRTGCQRCSSILTSVWLCSVLPPFVLAVLLYLFYLFFRDLPDQWGSWRKVASSLGFLTLRYFQVTSMVVESNLLLPAVTEHLLGYAGTTLDTMTLFNMDCAGYQGFMVSFAIRNLVPIAAFGEGFLMYAMSHAIARFARIDASMDLDFLVNTLFSFMYFFFTGISNVALTLFRCQSNPAGKPTLVKHPDVICFESGEWSSTLGLCIPAVLVYCIGSLVLFGYIICKAPKHFVQPHFQKRWKFLFFKYRPDVHWWSYVVLLQGVFLNLSTIISDDAIAQLTWLMLCQMMYSAALFIFMPWRSQAANVMDMITQGSSVLIFYIVSWTLHPTLPANYNAYFLAAGLAPLYFLPLMVIIYVVPRMRLARRGVKDCVTDEMMETTDTVCRMYAILSRQQQKLVLGAIGEHDSQAMHRACLAVWCELQPRSTSRLVQGHLRTVLIHAEQRAGGAMAEAEELEGAKQEDEQEVVRDFVSRIQSVRSSCSAAGRCSRVSVQSLGIPTSDDAVRPHGLPPLLGAPKVENLKL